MCLMIMEGDNGLSIAEVYKSGADTSNRIVAKLWSEFAQWYNKGI